MIRCLWRQTIQKAGGSCLSMTFYLTFYVRQTSGENASLLRASLSGLDLTGLHVLVFHPGFFFPSYSDLVVYCTCSFRFRMMFCRVCWSSRTSREKLNSICMSSCPSIYPQGLRREGSRPTRIAGVELDRSRE